MLVKVKYSGAAPGADSSNYTLFDSSTAFPGKDYLQMLCIKRATLSVKNAEAGTLKVYKSSNRGVAWNQVEETAVAAAAATAHNLLDVLVEPFSDVKIVWTNGGSAQTTWAVDIVLGDDRGPAS